jgi:CheY-like chemotaxis protein
MTERARAILVVEDDLDVREALATLLETQGYRVLEAENGLEALGHLRDADFDVCLILLDLFMPVMNREEQLRDPTMAAVPVVVVTADVGARRSGKDLRAAEYLTKPVDFDHLLAVVARHC